jgi:hypothetical protein
MNTRLQIALWSAAAVVGLAYTNGEAAPKVAVQNKSTPAASSPYAQVIHELHEAKHLLDHANHTYNGHRAKADHEIGKAIHVLHPEHHKHHAHHHHKTEPQSASDTQLRMAEKLVRAAAHELKKHNDAKAHEASKLLHQALHEIEQAIHAHHQHHAKNKPAAVKT